MIHSGGIGIQNWKGDMLFIAGLMGLFAVGTAAMLDFDDNDDDTEESNSGDLTENDTETGHAVTGLDALTAPEASDSFDGQTGTPADDEIVSREGTDWIAAYDGDDVVSGNDGQEALNGYGGDDTISGGAGDDTLIGEDGDDTLSGDSGHDHLTGGEGNDSLSGGVEDDTLIGSGGDDTLAGGSGNDALSGGLGNDHLSGGAGADTLFGGHGNDVIDGMGGEDDSPEMDFLNGGDGDDTIFAGFGDIVTTGQGQDDVVLSSDGTDAPPVEIMDFDPDQDRLILYWDSATLGAPILSFEIDDTGDGVLLANGSVVAHLGEAEVDPASVSVLAPQRG